MPGFSVSVSSNNSNGFFDRFSGQQDNTMNNVMIGTAAVVGAYLVLSILPTVLTLTLCAAACFAFFWGQDDNTQKPSFSFGN